MFNFVAFLFFFFARFIYLDFLSEVHRCSFFFIFISWTLFYALHYFIPCCIISFLFCLFTVVRHCCRFYLLCAFRVVVVHFCFIPFFFLSFLYTFFSRFNLTLAIFFAGRRQRCIGSLSSFHFHLLESYVLLATLNVAFVHKC